jgi:hypothetical protein
VTGLEATHHSIEVAPLVGVISGTVAVVLLCLMQVGIAARFRRRWNVGLAVATTTALAGAVVIAVAIGYQRDDLDDVRDAHAQAAVMSSIRILSLRSLSDVNLNLVEQGTEPSHLADFDRVVAQIDGESGLVSLAAAAGVADDDLAAVEATFQRYTAAEARVRDLALAGDYRAATALAVGDLAAAGRDLDGSVAQVIDSSRQEADRSSQDLIRAAEGTMAIVVVLTALAAFATIAGVRPRLREYR